MKLKRTVYMKRLEPMEALLHRRDIGLADDALDEVNHEQVPMHIELLEQPIAIEDPNGNPEYLFGELARFLASLMLLVRHTPAYPTKPGTFALLNRAAAHALELREQWRCDSSVFSIRHRPKDCEQSIAALVQVADAVLGPYNRRLLKTKPYNGYALVAIKEE